MFIKLFDWYVKQTRSRFSRFDIIINTPIFFRIESFLNLFVSDKTIIILFMIYNALQSFMFMPLSIGRLYEFLKE
jgi:hypothetical protein